MMNKTEFAPTPNYVLRRDNQSICPTIKFDRPETSCVSVYGFSDKPIYDEFIGNANQPLTPYPLVKGYLANQIAESQSPDKNGASLRLVILDATNLKQPVLSAVSMATVLQAQQDNAAEVAVEYELVFDPDTSCYQLAKPVHQP